MADFARMSAGETSAQFCRRMGWKVGDVIEGQAIAGSRRREDGPCTIEIVHLADNIVEAKETSRNGAVIARPATASWTLSLRGWRKA